MFPLERPTATAKTVFEACVERFVDTDFKKRMGQAQSKVLSAAQAYAAAGAFQALHAMPTTIGLTVVTGDELRALYTAGLLRRKSSARRYYEKIKLSTPHRICPICNHRGVATLDHYLPKQKYPHFSVTPDNLVPACYDCNFEKRASSYSSYAESPIHPYFDNFEPTDWLAATLVQSPKPMATFQVNAHGLTTIAAQKLNNHLETFGLFELYAIESAAEINRTERLLKSIHASSGQSGLQQYLQAAAASFKAVSRNSWRSALYHAASTTHWFSDCQW